MDRLDFNLLSLHCWMLKSSMICGNITAVTILCLLTSRPIHISINSIFRSTLGQCLKLTNNNGCILYLQKWKLRYTYSRESFRVPSSWGLANTPPVYSNTMEKKYSWQGILRAKDLNLKTFKWKTFQCLLEQDRTRHNKAFS